MIFPGDKPREQIDIVSRLEREPQTFSTADLERLVRHTTDGHSKGRAARIHYAAALELDRRASVSVKG